MLVLSRGQPEKMWTRKYGKEEILTMHVSVLNFIQNSKNDMGKPIIKMSKRLIIKCTIRPQHLS